jgi:hypothetical protein
VRTHSRGASGRRGDHNLPKGRRESYKVYMKYIVYDIRIRENKDKGMK